MDGLLGGAQNFSHTGQPGKTKMACHCKLFSASLLNINTCIWLLCDVGQFGMYGHQILRLVQFQQVGGAASTVMVPGVINYNGIQVDRTFRGSKVGGTYESDQAVSWWPERSLSCTLSCLRTCWRIWATLASSLSCGTEAWSRQPGKTH